MTRWNRMACGLALLLSVGLLTGCSGVSFGSHAGQTESSAQVEKESEASQDIFAMDTYMTVTAYGEKAQKAVSAAVDEINRLDRLFSVGVETSDVSVVNQNGSVILSKDTAELVERALEISKDVDGLFDITVYPLMEEWGFTTQQYQVPSAKQIHKLLAQVDYTAIEYDAQTRLLSLRDGIKIDLGGIAKGYTSNRIMEVFKQYDISSGMVSLGGNVQVLGTKTDGSLWRVAVRDPDAQEASAYAGVIETEDQAVITSGGYERYFEQDGKIYHHILDPRTGYPADNGLSSVTIVCPDGTLADGLSTSLFIMGREKAIAYWREHAEQFDTVLVESNGSITITEGLKDCFTSDHDYEVAKR